VLEIGLIIYVVFVTVALVWLFTNIMRPLDKLDLTMKDIIEGDDDLSVHLHDFRVDGLDNVASSSNKFISRLKSIDVVKSAYYRYYNRAEPKFDATIVAVNIFNPLV
jgi:sensor histidine kinase YesM